MSASKTATDIVVEILKKHGEWVETSPFVKKLAKIRDISERQAYRDLRESWKAGKVRKIKLPDGAVLNGLPNWGFPSAASEKKETLTFQDAFKYRCFKRLEEIGSLSLRRPADAFLELGNVIAMLSSAQREKLEPMYKAANKIVREIQEKGISLSISPFEMQNKTRALVRHLLGEVSKVLHES